ncbi:hypothetical protein I215_09426 [Galbibacter marinus]|uniref:Helix-turn-helix domain-containing protein n=1 Tax=Galbibacter marinus TaxID=555500 RepID=K2QK28_9FLAO|nr:helix-turn-helix domain-containing protein [Galbibacter marinus]EKF55072.1 hypothetical protein I215_09426 [Galbibacter marinus]
MGKTNDPDDLQDFKEEMIKEIKKIVSTQTTSEFKRYLKSTEVMSLLQVSSGTLQNLRKNGTLPYTKIGGMIYYDIVDIQNVMDENRVDQRSDP